tara:strand:+ start:97 stop:549 length:453 start_codon:yes stop_codon:yes gene_type:complete
MYIDDHMSLAMSLAEIAYDNDEVPVGAVVVKDGKVIGEGFNKVISKNSISAHAEILAINNASRAINNYRLKNCEIYVTLEPCHMCAKAIVDARLNYLYFGAKEPKTGAIESVDQFLSKDNLNHKVKFSGGHMQKESSEILKKFFQSKRGL